MRAALAIASASFALAIACGNHRDVVPESHDVHVDQKQDPNGGYEYVARRPLGVVALAEARGLSAEAAHAAMDRVADQMDACEKDARDQNRLLPGAVRIVAEVDDRGTIGGLNVSKLSQKEAAANAILCVIAPIRLLVFPPAEADAGSRGLAIEAAWGPETP